MPGLGAEGMGAILDTTVAAVAGATAVVGGTTGAGCAGPSGSKPSGAGGGMKGARVKFGHYGIGSCWYDESKDTKVLNGYGRCLYISV